MIRETMSLQLWAPDGRPTCRWVEAHDEVVTLALAAKAGGRESLGLLKQLARLWCVRCAVRRESGDVEPDCMQREELYLAGSPARGISIRLVLTDSALETPEALRAAKTELKGFDELPIEAYAALAWSWVRATDRKTLPEEGLS